MTDQGIQALSQPRFPLIFGADLGCTSNTGGVAGGTNLVIDLLAGEFDLSTGGFRHGEGHLGDRLDAVKDCGMLARAIIGCDTADMAHQGGYEEHHSSQQHQPRKEGDKGGDKGFIGGLRAHTSPH